MLGQAFHRKGRPFFRQHVHSIFDGVLQFPHIAWPIVMGKDIKDVGIDSLDIPFQLLIVAGNETLDQKRNIFFTFPQGGMRIPTTPKRKYRSCRSLWAAKSFFRRDIDV